MAHTAYISLGSNLGDRAANLRAAIAGIAALGTVGAVSQFYETEPREVTAQPWFLNCALELHTERAPRELLDGLLAMERTLGRERAGAPAKGPRIIDADILLFDKLVITEDGLHIPHPAMQQRRFVLAPLAEIAAGAFHPVLKKTVGGLLAVLPASAGEVRPWKS